MDSEEDYEVGYGKPPGHTRFAKGKSGNPKGRPKGSRNLRTDVREALRETVKVRINGRAQRVSAQQATIMRLREKALSGDPRALDRLLDLAGRYNNEELEETLGEALAPPQRAILDNYVERQRQKEARRAAAPNAAAEETPIKKEEDDDDDDDCWLG
jgi:hypothetical protein